MLKFSTGHKTQMWLISISISFFFGVRGRNYIPLSFHR